MADIYEMIWDADLASGNGVKAIRAGEATDGLDNTGYVFVDEKHDQTTSEHELLPTVHLPEAKRDSYRKVAAMFNNYTLDQTKPEHDFPEEDAEVRTYINFLLDSPPMAVVRDYVKEQSGQTFTEGEWRAMIRRIWFEHFDLGNNRDLSGFEHVLVGEQKKGTLQGYHFWYRYYMDENFRRPSVGEQPGLPDETAGGTPPVDLIKFLNWQNGPDDDTPEVVTLKYAVKFFDYEAAAFRLLTKPIGGFFVGPSAEAIIAMGTVRFLPEAAAPKQAVIHGYRYNLPLFKSPNDRNLRTFYPEFVGKVA